MDLINLDGQVLPQPWQWVTENESIPAQGNVIVDLPRWQAEGAALARREGGVGVALRPGDALEALLGSLDRLDLVALVFPKHTDGRLYTTARLLRQRHGFTGELLAMGEVYPDHMEYLSRCGVTAFAPVNVQRAISAMQVRTALRAYPGLQDRGMPGSPG